MDLPEGYPYKRVFLQCARKTKTRFTNLIENEIANLGKFKTQFGILVKSSVIWDDKTQYVEDYFLERVQDIFNIIDEATIIH